MKISHVAILVGSAHAILPDIPNPTETGDSGDSQAVELQTDDSGDSQAVEVETVATCETEELRCKAAVFKSNVCFNVKANVVTDNNKIAEFEKHGTAKTDELTTNLQASDDADHFHSALFQVTSIEPEDKTQVENYVITQQNGPNAFYFEVETTEAVMSVCGELELQLKEVYEEPIQDEAYWTTMADKYTQALTNFTSTDVPKVNFYFVNNPAECKINNGDCSHICEDSVCKCPNDCWELDMEGRTCHPVTGTIRTYCLANEMSVEIDACIVTGLDAMSSTWKSGDCAPTYDDVNDVYTIKSGLTDCGMEKTFSDDVITFANKLTIPPMMTQGIYFERPINMDFTCDYFLEDEVSSDFAIKKAVQKTVFNSGIGAFDFDLKFTDSLYQQQFDEVQSSNGQLIYYEVGMTGGEILDGIEWRVSSCSVTNRADSAQTFKVYDYQSTCNPFGSPVGMGQSFDDVRSFQRFQFQAFTFVGSKQQSQELSCEISICNPTDDDAVCKNGCYLET